MSAVAERLSELLQTIPGRFAGISAEEASRTAGPGRWSKKEILGHLIDSAGNNHQRFVRAQLTPHLEFPEYQQNSWVTVQAYATESWEDLVGLWVMLNRHLLHVIRHVPDERLSRPVSIGGKEAIPLSKVMEGYLEHLEHHLAQILDAASVPR